MGFRCAGRAVLVALALSVPASAAADPVPLAQIGSSGSGAGQLTFPSSVALDAASNVYVADAGNNRISEFGPGGAFIRAFGWGVDTGAGAFEVCTTASTCQFGNPGDGAGQFFGLTGIALDAAGNLYAADAFNNRISVFNTAGPTFTRAFGWGVDTGAPAFEVCTTASICQAGSGGGGAGQLSAPFGIAHDGVGGLYVADQLNNRISVFGTAGPSFTRAFGWGVDTGAPAFEVCTSTCLAGGGGGGAGQLNFPLAVALDGAGGLYVSDNGNSRISVFGTAGPSFTRAFGWDVALPDGDTAFEACPSGGACQAGDAGDGAGQFNIPSGVALDGAGGLYVAEQTNDRISVFGTAGPTFTRAFGWGVDTGASAFEVCTSTCQIGSAGSGAGQLSGPDLVAIDCRGAAWVADESNNRVQRFGDAGTPLPPCPATPPAGGGSTSPPPGPTGQRAAANRRCKKKFPKGPRRTKCIKKAKRLPI